MPDPEYSFCEATTKPSRQSPWHIRRLTEEGWKLGGGADTPALCGRTVGRDVPGCVATWTPLFGNVLRPGDVCARCLKRWRILQEQRAARDHLAEHGPDRGAEQGASDWVAEEVIAMADDLERAE